MFILKPSEEILVFSPLNFLPSSPLKADEVMSAYQVPYPGTEGHVSPRKRVAQDGEVGRRWGFAVGQAADC